MTKKKGTSTKAQGVNVHEVNQVQNANMISSVWSGTQYIEGLTHEELVQRENSLINNYKIEASNVKAKLAQYKRTLESTLSDMHTLYNGGIVALDNCTPIEIKANIDALVRLSGVPVEKFFDAKFVGGLFDTYTFQLLEGVQTLKAKKMKVSEKTDFAKLEDRAQRALGYYVNIGASVFTEKGTRFYWMPILNFTADAVLKSVFVVNKDSLFRIEREALKAAKRSAKAKAKKAEKKAKKEAEKANTEESK